MKVCVIGAGVSGIAMCQQLKINNIDFDCFEKSSSIGGIWNYKTEPYLSSVYKNCILNHSSKIMSFPFLNIDSAEERFLHRQEFFAYLEQAVDYADIEDNIKLSSVVDQAVPQDNGDWIVTVDGAEHNYSHVVFCTGFYSQSNIPDIYSKDYSGDIYHSSEYRDPVEFADKKVLVVGSGSSAVQIACDLSNVADVSVSVRSMPYIIPKFLFGLPYNRLFFKLVKKLPIAWQNTYIETILKISNGDQVKFGLPKPVGRVLECRLPISSDIFEKVSCGQIKFMPGIKSAVNKSIVFNDGVTEDFDKIIYATGYKVDIDLIPGYKFDINDNYKFISSMSVPNLFFCGFLQPVGPVPPVVFFQAKYICGVIAGKIQQPSLSLQNTKTQELITKLSQRYTGNFSGRVEVTDYLELLNE